MNLYDIKKKAINVFAANGLKEIEENNCARLTKALGVPDYTQLLKNDEFKEYYCILKEMREELDSIIGQTDGIAQIKECLHLLKEEKGEQNKKNFEILVQLIKKGLYKNWNPGEREYFDEGLDMLTRWKDFFFSYTGRNLRETNSDFKEILSDVFGKDFENNREKMNYVARLIVGYLCRNNLASFFDQDNMTCGDIIKDKVFNHCKSTFTFVQLIEMETFHARDDQTNWCFEEFKTFSEWIEKSKHPRYDRYHFILADNKEKVFPANFPNTYIKWRETIKERVHLDLSSLRDNKLIRDKVREIAHHIAATKNSILDDYIN